MASNLTCALCGAEVIQEGAYLKCQNWACKTETPIDVDQITRAQSYDKYEALDEATNDQ